MKLISKFHDYYDGVVGTTRSDPSILFIREQRDIIKNDGKFKVVYYRDNNNIYEFYLGVVGFCGTIYPFVMAEEISLGYAHSNTKYYYTIDDFFAEYKGISNSKKNNYHTISHVRTEVESWLKDGEYRNWWQLYYKVYEDKQLKELFLKERIVYFAIHGSKETPIKIKVYPNLKEMEFYKKFDSYTTFQMIEMYLSNQLIQHDTKIINISDKLKAQSKGFNKWSFRKMPEEK